MADQDDFVIDAVGFVTGPPSIGELTQILSAAAAEKEPVFLNAGAVRVLSDFLVSR